MNNIIILIIGVIIFIIILQKFNNAIYVEHLTNDEAVKNLASLYNTGNLTATNLTATGNLKSPKIQLGDKWVLSGVAGTDGNNDTWLRLLDPNGQYAGGLAVGQLWLRPAFNPDVAAALNNLNTRVTTAQNGVNNAQAGVNNAQVKGQQDIKLFPGRRIEDGWDVRGDFQTSSFGDCVNQCKNNKYALSALHRASDNRCWCKSIPAFGKTGDPNWHNGWNSAIFI